MLSPLRADVVGSLLRPDAVRQARADFRAGRINSDQLTAAEDAAVRYLVELQRDCGLPVVTDGEVRRGIFLKSGGYEGLIATMYEEVPNISTLMLEFDDERSGGVEPLCGAPEDKILVLGLVSTKVPELEARDALIARIEQAAGYVPVEQLAISTQCGFASTTSGVPPLSEADERAKLALVADVAQAVWG